MSAKYICYRWAVDIKNFTPSLTQLLAACRYIQPEERTRLAKFHFIDDFLSSLVGRLLMRKFISTVTNIKYNEVKFKRDVRGKPFLENSQPDLPNISFNVSHHGGMIVLAGLFLDIDVQQQQQNEQLKPSLIENFGVGIDVMKIEYTGGKTLSEFFRIMTRNFSPSEWRYINRTQHTENDRLKAFIRHWCLKESFVKNLGVGLSLGLEKICFSIQSDDLDTNKIVTNTTLRLDDVPAGSWFFEEQMLDPEYCVAIAYKDCKPSELGKFTFFSFDELLFEDDECGTSPTASIEYCRKVLALERKQTRS